MSKTVKRAISLLLVAVLLVGTFSGCVKTSAKEAITATAVNYSADGNYTTTVSSKKVDLSGLTADKVEVRYHDPDSDIVINEDGSVEKPGVEDYYNLTATVDSVIANGNGWDIAFTGENNNGIKVSEYAVFFDGVEDFASSTVQYPEITVTPDIEYVARANKDFKISFAANGGEFSDDISADDISLSDSFYGMEAEVISSSANNLTVQIKGDIVPNEANAYLWGTVNLKPSAFKDAFNGASSHISIMFINGYLDGASLKFENGKATVNYVSFVGNVDSLTKDNVKIDDVTVEAVERVDDEIAKLTLSADGVKSANDLVDAINGKNIEADGLISSITLSQAYFYPVYDLIEDDGDNIKITLKLFILNGSAESLKAKQVSFADDFEGAKVVSITPEKDNDTVCEMIISLPANGRSADGFTANGTVTIAAGGLTNLWGDATSVEASHTRDYSSSSLGRDLGDMFSGDIDFSDIGDISDALDAASKTADAAAATSEIMLNPQTLLEIQKYTRGLDTTFGKICYYGQIAGTVLSIAKTIMEATGMIESEHAQEMRVLNEINGKLDTILSSIHIIDQKLDEVQVNVLKNSLIPYNEALQAMKNEMGTIKNMTDYAKEDLRIKYPKIYGNVDEDELSEDEITEYMHDVMEYIREQAKDTTNTKYGSYAATLKDLYDNFISVSTKLALTNDQNPISIFDQICSYAYNFDTEAYAQRLSQRMYAKTTLMEAYSMLAICYDYVYDYKNPNMRGVSDHLREAFTTIDEMEYIGHTAKEILENQYTGRLYLSSILISYGKTEDEAKLALSGRGYYIPSDINLIQNGGPSQFAYLGCKFTSNPNEAIRDVWLSDIQNMNDKSGNLVNVIGNLDFSGDVSKRDDFKGCINNGSHLVQKYYLYYAKNPDYDAAPLTGLLLNSNPENALNKININSSDDYDYEPLYLHKQDVNYEYAPFCYPLGRKIALFSSTNWNNYFGEFYTYKHAMIDLTNNTNYDMTIGYQDETINYRMRGVNMKTSFLRAGLEVPNDFGIATKFRWDIQDPFAGPGAKYYLYSDMIYQTPNIGHDRKLSLYKNMGSNGRNNSDDEWDRYVQFNYVQLLGTLPAYDHESRPTIYHTFEGDEGTYTFNKDGTGTFNGTSFTYTTSKVSNGTELIITMNGKKTTYIDHYVTRRINADGTNTLTLVILDRRLDTHIFTCTVNP